MRVVALASASLVGVSLLSAPPALAQDAPSATSAASAVCDGVVNASGVATAEGTVTVPSGSPLGSRVYAFELESGKVTCVQAAADGAFTLPLPGLTAGQGLRRPADGWVLSVSAPDGVDLGSTSQLLTWDAVTIGGTVSGISLALGEVSVRAGAVATETRGTFPTLICSAWSNSLASGACGVATANDPDSQVLLAAGFASYTAVDAFAVVSGGLLTGSAEGVGSSSLTVQLSSPTTAGQCGAWPVVSGRVTRDVDGVAGRVAANITIEAIPANPSASSRQWLTGGRTSADGTFSSCLDSEVLSRVPASGVRIIVVAEPLTGGVKTVQEISRDCLQGCAGVEVSLGLTPSVGGTISPAGAPANSLFGQHPYWNLWMGSLSGTDLVTQYYISEGMADARGRWGLAFVGGLSPLANGSHVVEVVPADRAQGYSDARVAFNVASSQGTANVSLSRGNVVGRVLSGPGTPQSWSWLSIQSHPCREYCRSFGTSVDRQGWFSVNLPDGDYRLTAQPSWDDSLSTTTTFDVTVSGGNVTKFMGSAATTPLTLRLRSPNATLVVRQGGQALSYVGMAVSRWLGGTDGPSYDQDSWRSSTTDGVVTEFLEPGAYRVVLYPSSSLGLGPVVQGWRVSSVNGQTSIAVCQKRPGWWADPCPPEAPASTLPKDGSGRWLVDFPEPRIIATVTSPDRSQALPWANVCVTYTQTDEWGNTYSDGWCTQASESGTIGLPLTDSGTYQVRVAKPGDLSEDWAEVVYEFEVDSDGDICARVSRSLCDPVSDTRVTLPLRGANVIATIRGVGESLLPYGWVEIYQDCRDYLGCQRWILSTHVSSQGRLAVNLDASDDTYYLRVHPQGLSDGSVTTTFPVKVSNSQTVQKFDWTLRAPNVSGRITDWQGQPMVASGVQVQRLVGSQWIWQDAYAYTDLAGDYRLLLDPGTYRLRVFPDSTIRSRAVATTGSAFTVGNSAVTTNLTMRRPNLVGRVVASGNTALAHSWIDVQQWYPAYGYYDWSPDVSGTDTSSTGDFGLDLPEGKWRLVVRAPWGSLNVSRTIVAVVSDGTGVCLDNGSSCTPDRYLDANYVLTMEQPNASGHIVMPDGVSRISDGWIDVRRWSALSSSFVWDFDLPSASIGTQASFALRLPAGRWQLTAHPDSGRVGATRNSIDVTVDNVGLCLTSDAPCDVDDSIGPGNLRIALRAPNVSGVVTRGGTPVLGAWVYTERWRAEWGGWEWSDLYSSSSLGGAYSLTIDTPGTYRITARGPGNVRGFTDGKSYVNVDDTGICEISAPEVNSAPSTTCTGPRDDSVGVNTQLAPANFVAEIRDDSVTMPWMWVQLQEKTDYGWHWREGRSTIADGSVSFTVSTPADDTTHYRLFLDPAWGGPGEFSRTLFDFIAYRQTSDGPVLTCALADWDSTARVCGDPISVDQAADVQLATAGLRVSLSNPDSTPAAWSWVYVERWSEDPWSSGSYRWQWEDAYGYTRGTGNVTLPVTDPGVYRLTAEPRWPNLEGYAPRRQIVQIDAQGQWCLQGASSDTTADAFGACESSPSPSSTRVAMTLATSNVVGGLVFDDTVGVALISRGMPYGWIEVRDDSGNYVTSVGTTNQGRFALRLEDGNYTLIGYPNWQFSQRPPVRLPITVQGDAVTDGLTGGELILDLDSVPPNVTLTIDDVTGARLVAVEVETSSGWESASQYNVVSSGGATNLAKFALPVGRYRLSVVPEIDHSIVGENSVLVEVTSASGQYPVSVSITENPASS